MWGVLLSHGGSPVVTMVVELSYLSKMVWPWRLDDLVVPPWQNGNLHVVGKFCICGSNWLPMHTEDNGRWIARVQLSAPPRPLDSWSIDWFSWQKSTVEEGFNLRFSGLFFSCRSSPENFGRSRSLGNHHDLWGWPSKEYHFSCPPKLLLWIWIYESIQFGCSHSQSSLGCRAATMTTYNVYTRRWRQAAAVVAEVVSDVGHAEHLSAAMIPTYQTKQPVMIWWTGRLIMGFH